MLKKIRTIAVVLLLMMAASCQKETISEPFSYTAMDESSIVYYTIDGEPYWYKIESEEQMYELLYALFAKAESGSVVTINRSGNCQNKSVRETITYSTSSKPDAYAWAANMISQGYNVSVTYDPNTGLFNCIATKK
jgi:hypothetical protein